MKKFLIHFLGGITKEECRNMQSISYRCGAYSTLHDLKSFSDQMDGTPADDWCKLIYNHICGSIHRVMTETQEAGAAAATSSATH